MSGIFLTKIFKEDKRISKLDLHMHRFSFVFKATSLTHLYKLGTSEGAHI